MRLWNISNQSWGLRKVALNAILQWEGRIENVAIHSEGSFSERLGFHIVNSVAIVPVYGVIEQRSGLFTELLGGSSYEKISAQIIAAMQDDEISRIVLDIDSPGGLIQGVAELADMIWTAKDKKPIIAVANNTCASAAYWIASACSEVVAAGPTSLLGSIGVVAVHRDYSKFEAQMGIKTTEVVSGQYKRVASSHEPLSDMGRQMIQAQVDKYYQIFIEAVAKYRGISSISAHERMGDGREFIGQDAIDVGLANRMESFTELISRQALNSGKITYSEREIIAMAEDKKEEEEKKAKMHPEEEEEEEEEKPMDKHMALTRERERICGILALADCGLDELTKEAIQQGTSRGDYAVKLLQSKPKRLAALERESKVVPVGQIENQDMQLIMAATDAVNKKRRR